MLDHVGMRQADRKRLLCIVVPIAAILAAIVMIAVSSSTPALAGTTSASKGSAAGSNNPLSIATVPVVQEGFEDTSFAFTQFSVQVATCVPGGCGWGIVNTDAHNSTYSVYVPDSPGVTDQQLLLAYPAIIPQDATSANLSFWMNYDFEMNPPSYYDGGVIEVTTDSGANWVDAGSLITASGYNAIINTGAGNPLLGRHAWVGTTGHTWVHVQVNLISYKGSNVQFRLRLGTDASNLSTPAGWWVDDILLTYQANAPCAPAGWLEAQPYPTIMADNAAVALGSGIYSFGGLNGTVNSVSYKYDSVSNTWLPIASLPSARFNASAAQDGTYIYIVGGRDASISDTNTAYRYDPLANNYSVLPPISQNLSNVAVVVLNGKLYRIGGENSNVPVSSAEAYSLANHTWSPIAPLPTAVTGQAVIAYNNYIYVAGGQASNGAATPKTYRYDPSTNTWSDSSIADMPAARTRMSADLYNGLWLFAGGIGNYGGYTSSMIAWDPLNNSWRSMAQLPAPDAAAPGVSVGGHFYIPGGVDAESYIRATVRLYSEGSCPAPTNTPTSTRTPTLTPSPSPTSCSLQFSDVLPSNTFYSNIRCLSCRGIINGYPDSTFKPNNNVTRGQLSKIVSNSAGFNDVQSIRMFEDVPVGSTFFQFIGRLASRGFIGGYQCGGAGEPCGPGSLPYFRPNANATRGQISKIVSNTAGFSDAQPNQMFADVPLGSTYQLFIGRLASRGYMSGYLCGGAGEPCVQPGSLHYFRPNNNATRGQTSKIVGNTFFPNCQTP